jgi:phage tail protein X
MSGKYVTVQGDMWDSISYKLYGNSKHLPALIQANLAHKNTFIFPAGVELTVPEVDSSSVSSSVPPWKRVRG